MPEQVQCPKCQQTLRLPDTLMGKKVKCPKCATIFEGVAKPNSGSVPKEPRSPEQPAPAPRKKPAPPPPDEYEEDELPVSKKRPAARDEDYEEEDDLEEEPRPKKKKKGGRKRALDKVYAPATVMQVLGVIGLVAFFINTMYAIIVLGPAGFVELLGKLVVTPYGFGRVAGMVLGPLWYLAVLLYAGQMKKLASYRSSLILSIMAMIPCTCLFLGLPFGIWSLITINSPEVRPYFDS